MNPIDATEHYETSAQGKFLIRVVLEARLTFRRSSTLAPHRHRRYKPACLGASRKLPLPLPGHRQRPRLRQRPFSL